MGTDLVELFPALAGRLQELSRTGRVNPNFWVFELVCTNLINTNLKLKLDKRCSTPKFVAHC